MQLSQTTQHVGLSMQYTCVAAPRCFHSVMIQTSVTPPIMCGILQRSMKACGLVSQELEKFEMQLLFISPAVHSCNHIYGMLLEDTLLSGQSILP